MNHKNIKNGALCQLTIGRWSAIVTLPKSNLGKTVPKEIIKITQDIIQDKQLIRKISKIRRESKLSLLKMALPFPIRGVYWVHKNNIKELNAIFQKKEKEYYKNVQDLCKQLPKIKRKFKRGYPNFYKEVYYPTKDELKQKFYFSWNFFTFGFPDKDLSIIPGTMHTKEKQKFSEMINRIEQMTINIIVNSLLVKVRAFLSQCRHKKFNDATILSFTKITRQWNETWKDNVKEPTIRNVMKQVEINAKKITKKKLVENKIFQNKIKRQMSKIEKQILSIPNIKLNRQLKKNNGVK